MSNKNIHLGKHIVLWSSLWGNIAAQDSATPTFNQELIELVADADGWRQYTKGKKDTSIALSGLMLINEELMKIDQSIRGIFDELLSVDDNVFELRYRFTQTGEYISIPCLVESFVPNGDATGYGTYSASFRGTGKPTWNG